MKTNSIVAKRFFAEVSNLKRNLIFTAFILMSLNVWSQDKKDLREAKIKTITTYEEKTGKNKKELIESIVSFNEFGNVIEEKEFNNEGEFKKHVKIDYDGNQNKIKESEFDEKGNIIEYTTYKYKGNLKVEKITFDQKGNIMNKKRYVYTTHP